MYISSCLWESWSFKYTIIMFVVRDSSTCAFPEIILQRMFPKDSHFNKWLVGAREFPFYAVFFCFCIAFSSVTVGSILQAVMD